MFLFATSFANAQDKAAKNGIAKSKPSSSSKAVVDAVPAANVDSLISNAVAEIERNDLVSALGLARKAVTAAPINYKAHYYVGLVLLRMGSLDQAEDAAFEAVRFAPPEAQADVKKLQQAIVWARVSTLAAREAETAQNDGLNGKAAASWKQAWEAGYQNAEFGVNAAQLYAQRLAQPVAAAKILREVLEKSNEQTMLDKSTALLKAISSQLDAIAADSFQKAKQTTDATQMGFIRATLDADPNHIGAYELLARYHVNHQEISQLREVLKDLSRRNRLDLAVMKHEDFFELLKQPEFTNWLNDLVGDVAAKSLLNDVAELERKRDARLRYEQEMRDYAAAMTAYQEKMALFAKYGPCITNTRQNYSYCEARIPAPDNGFLGIGNNADERAKLHAACVASYNERVAQCQAAYPSTAPVEPSKPVRPAQ